ncbi:ElyC/SanA/YdcF family protein [soil metagenome]
MVKKPNRIKRGFQIIGGLLAAVGLFCLITNEIVLSDAKGKIFTSTSSIPREDIALVLGTSPKSHGIPNVFFERRMNATADLYKAGKVTKVLVSGDNGTPYYDEPSAMQAALINRGIPAKDIVKDCAGFRTLDSVVRAREVFKVDKCTIVTDDFHLPRALYIASQHNIDAIGYQTTPVDHRVSPWTYVREVGARSLVWLDLHIINRQPRFLGTPEPIAGL